VSEGKKIFVDQGVPAILWSGERALACPTLKEAMLEWNRLSAEQKLIATIGLDDGAILGPNEIYRLYHTTKPAI
jgi:hypothetical protein